LVSLPAVEFGRFTAGIGPTCYMFELQTPAQVEQVEALTRRIEDWIAGLESLVAALEATPSEATWASLVDQRRQRESMQREIEAAGLMKVDAKLAELFPGRRASIKALYTRLEQAIYAPAWAAAQGRDWQSVEMWADRLLQLNPNHAAARALKDQAVAALRGSNAPSSTGAAAQAAPTESIVGTWSGIVDQPGFDKYPVTMSMTSPGAGKTEYSTLKCGGTLLREGGTSSLTYTETITHGADFCISEGKITLGMVAANELQWEWSHPTGGTASARLKRAVSSQETSSGVTAGALAEKKYEQIRVEPGQTTAWIQVPQGGCVQWHARYARVWVATNVRKVVLHTPGIRFTHIAFTAPDNHQVNVRYYIDPSGNCSDAVP
jgi:hypothetical protein